MCHPYGKPRFCRTVLWFGEVSYGRCLFPVPNGGGCLAGLALSPSPGHSAQVHIVAVCAGPWTTGLLPSQGRGEKCEKHPNLWGGDAAERNMGAVPVEGRGEKGGKYPNLRARSRAASRKQDPPRRSPQDRKQSSLEKTRWPPENESSPSQS